MRRSGQRGYDHIRSVSITPHITRHADGSVLFEIGGTKVICTVTLTHGVPLFLRGKNKWWLTASYALLPASTHNRIEREGVGKRNDRSIEISRLIGRSLRSICDLTQKETEKTIHVDCDVIQADGGTRTACVTGAFIALQIAQERWIKAGLIPTSITSDEIAAVSVGVRKDQILLDIDFAEDSSVEADFNFVMTRSGNVVEMQGAAERSPISWEQVLQMQQAAQKGISQLFEAIDQFFLPFNSPQITPQRKAT